jgi:hypothetical protein
VADAVGEIDGRAGGLDLHAVRELVAGDDVARQGRSAQGETQQESLHRNLLYSSAQYVGIVAGVRRARR